MKKAAHQATCFEWLVMSDVAVGPRPTYTNDKATVGSESLSQKPLGERCYCALCTLHDALQNKKPPIGRFFCFA